MTRWRLILALALMLFNLPWMGMWWHLTDPSLDRGPSATALYMILIICTVGMILIPVFLGDTAGKRWLLILILGITNLYWCLRWIEAFANTTPMDAAYAHARHVIVNRMALSSLGVVLLYLLADRALGRKGGPVSTG